MGKKRLKQAEELGFLEFPLTVLYGRVKKMRWRIVNLYAQTAAQNIKYHPSGIRILEEFNVQTAMTGLICR